MNSNDIDKAYISPDDKFMYEFDKTHKKSASQLKEIEKYQRIFALRDSPKAKQENLVIWEKF